MEKTLFLSLFIIIHTFAFAEQVDPPVVLPSPQEMLLSNESCEISNTSKIKYRVDENIPSEGYTLKIEKDGVTIASSDDNGVIYAKNTLEILQLQYESAGKIPCLEIKDAPRVKWRSFMLDSGRQFHQISTIKKYIDLLSLLKFNRFHWHLTEGLGWRVEIKKYPNLTSVGAFVGTGAEQKGYYKQEEIKEIVQYAKERGITVVPEIDMPGHAEAALNSYPEMGCFNEKPSIPNVGFTHHIFCAGKPSTISFLKDVIDEICELFPSEYIHLGGDEAPKGNWNKCADCQNRIEEFNLKDSHDLQRWFSAEMASYLKTKNRKAIFWGDAVYTDGYALPDNVVIHWWNWRGRKDLAYRHALSKGHEVIGGTNYYSYLNFPVTPFGAYNENRTFDIEDVYKENPSFIIDPNPLVIGMSCALWTDHNLTENMLDRRLMPRIFALAQQMWYKGEQEPFGLFYEKVKKLKPFFEEMDYEFGPGLKSEAKEGYKWD